MESLAGQTALVTGGGRGIGRDIAVELARQGMRVAVTSRTRSELDATVAEMGRVGEEGFASVSDASEPRSVHQTVQRTTDAFGKIDLLVNNAAAKSAIGPVAEVDGDAWWHDLATNLRGPFAFMQAVLPDMIARRSGRIVNIVSNEATRTGAYNSSYGSSKAALVRLTESVAVECRDAGIAAFALSPGTVHTRLSDTVVAAYEAGGWHGQRRATVRRAPNAAQAAAAVAFLASGEGDGLSGRFFDVDDDVCDLAPRAEEIARDDLYQLRKRTSAT